MLHPFDDPCSINEIWKEWHWFVKQQQSEMQEISSVQATVCSMGLNFEEFPIFMFPGKFKQLIALAIWNSQVWTCPGNILLGIPCWASPRCHRASLAVLARGCGQQHRCQRSSGGTPKMATQGTVNSQSSWNSGSSPKPTLHHSWNGQTPGGFGMELVSKLKFEWVAWVGG